MKKIMLFHIFLIITVWSCNNEKAANQENEVKDEQVSQKDTTTNIQPDKKEDTAKTATTDQKERKLRYLFYSNGGLVAYFNDGTVVGCPRCDLRKENVDKLYTEKTSKKYIVKEDGSLLVDGNQRLFPKAVSKNGNREWAVIDYKWVKRIY